MVITPGTGTHALASQGAARAFVRPAAVDRIPRVRGRLVRQWRANQRVGHDAACPTGPPADGFFAASEAVAVRVPTCPPGFFFAC